LDYDDLLRRAAALLRDHADVRAALANRWRHVLVDEFQDTDPLQAEIVWRLTGVPNDDDWRTWPARPGARFVVGDPKQSIYRFRGADVRTYAMLKDRMADDPGADLLTIGTNFRSVPGVLTFTNDVFAGPMERGEHQPDYAPLAPFRTAAADAPPAVATLPLTLPVPLKPSTKGWSDAVRASEARRVADLCVALLDPDAEPHLPGLTARDVALLAPVGTDLERYESELEARGVAVASQAGKNYYVQQVVFDLLALARTLVDPADTLALGALLRGPLIGVPDAALLDAQAAWNASAPRPGPLRTDVDPDVLPDGPVRDALRRLAPLAADAATRTPYAVLRDAVDALDVRATLRARNPRHAGRDLANLEAFLDGAHAYAARGLHAYVRATWRAWNDAERTGEAERDAVEDAVSLITVHAAKGLEWRVVIPINAFGTSRAPTPPHVGSDGVLAHRLLGHATTGFDDATERATKEADAERLRLWYVAVTRAKDVLVLPEPTFETKAAGWHALVDWPFDRLAKLDPPPAARDAGPPALRDAGPDEGAYAARSAALRAARRRVVRRAPSTHPDPERPLAAPDEGTDDLTPPPRPTVGAGTLRGRLVHVLLEERIHGLLPPARDDGGADGRALAERAATLHAQLAAEHPDAAADVDPDDVAAQVEATWQHPAVAALHGRLLAEVDVHGVRVEVDADGEREVLISGIADAVALDDAGHVTTVVDWKSDRDASEATRAGYREQVRGYLALLGASEGLLVFTATGEVERVTPADA
ncbi:MAG: UvrD-helicase domain-containing protein, partial [Trueperaceae bacterium]|nr:UvrD-helicase domain-containing protein [Trueperaceae bacterium]